MLSAEDVKSLTPRVYPEQAYPSMTGVLPFTGAAPCSSPQMPFDIAPPLHGDKFCKRVPFVAINRAPHPSP